jgi:hypothetical protein
MWRILSPVRAGSWLLTKERVRRLLSLRQSTPFDHNSCVCPNHHVELDYGAINLEKSKIRDHPEHVISEEYILYHNEVIYKGKRYNPAAAFTPVSMMQGR